MQHHVQIDGKNRKQQETDPTYLLGLTIPSPLLSPPRRRRRRDLAIFAPPLGAHVRIHGLLLGSRGSSRRLWHSRGRPAEVVHLSLEGSGELAVLIREFADAVGGDPVVPAVGLGWMLVEEAGGCGTFWKNTIWARKCGGERSLAEELGEITTA